MGKLRKRLSDDEANSLELKLNKKLEGRKQASYYITEGDWESIKLLRQGSKSKSKSNDYKKKDKFVLSAWNKKGYMMDIDQYCAHYKLPRKDISSYKLVSHTGTPYYNIVFKELVESKVQSFDFEKLVKKLVDPVDYIKKDSIEEYNFDVLTFTDVHIGMDPDHRYKSMYGLTWDVKDIEDTFKLVSTHTFLNRKSPKLIIDDLGDLMDGLNGYTTRGGHKLPQLMSDEDAFSLAVRLKVMLVQSLVHYYDVIEVNNVCNDNHGGKFSFFVNEMVKSILEIQYKDKVFVTNHRTFMSHYVEDEHLFIISHGKDDEFMTSGMKPKPGQSELEKIDQYIKQNNLYSLGKKIIFKKGDSHQAVLDMSSTDDFYYYNYPALSPSSEWVQTNFKKGRRGFFIEHFKGKQQEIKPIFI